MRITEKDLNQDVYLEDASQTNKLLQTWAAPVAKTKTFRILAAMALTTNNPVHYVYIP